MKKLLVIALLFVSAISFAQETPCHLTAEQIDGKTIYRGERNYLNTEYDNLRVCIQYLYDGEDHCLGLTFDTQSGITVLEKSEVFVQFSNDAEEKVPLKSLIKTDKKIECRFAISKEQEKVFSHEQISAVYFSTVEYPQIEIPEIHKYTGRKIMERFNCAITTIEK